MAIDVNDRRYEVDKVWDAWNPVYVRLRQFTDPLRMFTTGSYRKMHTSVVLKGRAPTFELSPKPVTSRRPGVTLRLNLEWEGNPMMRYQNSNSRI